MSVLALLLKLFGNSIDLPELAAKLAARLLDGVTDSSGCKEHLLQMIRSGTLDDKFAEDPLGVGICVVHVLLALAEKARPHDVHVIGSTPDVWVGALASAMKTQLPMTASGEEKGVLIELLITQLATKLIELILNRLKK